MYCEVLRIFNWQTFNCKRQGMTTPMFLVMGINFGDFLTWYSCCEHIFVNFDRRSWFFNIFLCAEINLSQICFGNVWDYSYRKTRIASWLENKTKTKTWHSFFKNQRFLCLSNSLSNLTSVLKIGLVHSRSAFRSECQSFHICKKCNNEWHVILNHGSVKCD